MCDKIQKLKTTLARTDTRSLMLIWLCLYLDRKNLKCIISTFCISKKRTIIGTFKWKTPHHQQKGNGYDGDDDKSHGDEH